MALYKNIIEIYISEFSALFNLFLSLFFDEFKGVQVIDYITSCILSINQNDD